MTRPQKIALGGIGSAIILFALIGMFMWRHSDFGDAAANFNKAVAEYKKAGLPWVASDLAQNPSVKDKDNAAPLVWKAIDKHKTIKSFRQEESDLDAALRSLDSKLLKVCLRDLSPLLNDSFAIAAKPDCDFRHDLDLGNWDVYPELATLKVLAKILAADAILAARDQNIKRATRDIWAINKLGIAAGSIQNVLGMLVRIAIQVTELRAIEAICEAFHGDAASLQKIAAVFNNLDMDIDFGHYMAGEAYLALATFRNLDNKDEIDAFIEENKGKSRLPTSPDCVIRDGEPPRLLAKIMLCRILQVCTRSIEIIRKSPTEEEAAKAVDRYVKSPEVDHWSYYIARAMMPSYAGAGISVTKWNASKAATEALIGVHIYLAKTGRLPRSLQEAKINSLDPFSGKPLIYRRTGNSFKVYSVGQDHKDNGGIRNEEVKAAGKKVKEFDLVASYPAFRRPIAGSTNPSSASK